MNTSTSAAGLDRRNAILLLATSALAGAVTAARAGRAPEPPQETTPRRSPVFTLSLAQWSLHRTIRDTRQLDPFDFPRAAKHDYGIDAVEYVSTFYRDRHGAADIAELRRRCDDLGVASLLIMCDGEGHLGDPDESKRIAAARNHVKWLDAARALGCHSIRVNAYSEGPRQEQVRLAADGLHRLCELADPYGLNVIVENHGGLSSDGQWLAEVMRTVDHKRVGTLPDFGNFRIRDGEEYDRYKGIAEMMPFARGVSAKSHDFDDKTGEETRTDYRRMMKIVLDAGYRGRVGIEYEGSRLSEPEGVRATKKLLERVRDELAPAYKT